MKLKLSTIAIFILLIIIAVLWFGPSLINKQPAVTPTPTLVPPTPTPAEEKNITVTNPTPDSQIDNPITIKGQARVFENVLNYRVKDSTGKVLAEGHTTADAPDVGQFGPFGMTVKYQKPATASGVIEVYSLSAKDGSEMNLVQIAVKFIQ